MQDSHGRNLAVVPCPAPHAPGRARQQVMSTSRRTSLQSNGSKIKWLQDQMVPRCFRVSDKSLSNVPRRMPLLQRSVRDTHASVRHTHASIGHTHASARHTPEPRVSCCRTNMARVRQSRPDSGRGFQVESFKPLLASGQPPTGNSSHKMHLSMSLRKSTPPQNLMFTVTN